MNTIHYVNPSLYDIDLFNFYINKETKYSFNIFEFSSLIFLSNFNTSNAINMDAQTNNAIDMNLIFSVCSSLQKNNIIFKEKLMFKFETLLWEEKFKIEINLNLVIINYLKIYFKFL